MMTLALAMLVLQPKMPDNVEAMKRVDWIVGAWTGAGEMKDMGKYTYDIAFEQTLSGNFLKVTQTVKTPDSILWHSTGYLGWDVVKKQFAWFQFGFDGTIGWTRTKDAGEDGVIVMEGQLTGGGPFANFRTTFRRTDKDVIRNRIEFLEGAKATLFSETDFKRAEKPAEHKTEAADAGHLKKLEWMIGTWVGSGEMQGFGKYEDEYVLSKTHGGNFIRNDYWMRVDGKVVWHDTGLIGWDVDKKKYVGVNFGFDGTIGWGEGGDGDDDVYTWEGETVGPSEKGKFRAVIKRIDADTMGMKIERRDGDKWLAYGPDQTRKRKK